ncbi:MAG: hypothetical protein RI894_1958 [Bacteroidota bacterium]|jgi:hypothetical protein
MLNLLLYSFLYFASFFAGATSNTNALKSGEAEAKIISTATNWQTLQEPQQTAFLAIITDSDILEDDNDDDESQDRSSVHTQFDLYFIVFLQRLACFFNLLPNTLLQIAAQQAIEAATHTYLLPTHAIGAGLQVFRI